MTIRGNGNIGIGITDPSTYKLYVNGTTYMTEQTRISTTDGKILSI
jgi:hypothetical protein